MGGRGKGGNRKRSSSVVEGWVLGRTGNDGGKNVKSAVSRVVVAVSVVAALGATAACGGSGDDGEKSAKPGAGSAKGGGDAATRLEKAALVAGDVKGYKVEKPEARDTSSG